MEWLCRGREPDDEVTEVPVPTPSPPPVVNLTSDDEDGDQPPACELPSSAPTYVHINVEYHVKEEEYDFEDTDTGHELPVVDDPSFPVEDFKMEDCLNEGVDPCMSPSPAPSCSPIRPDTPPVKVEISEEEQRAALFGEPRGRVARSPSPPPDSPSPPPDCPSPPPDCPSPPPDSPSPPPDSPSPPPTSRPLHPLELPSAQPVVLLRRVDEDPDIVARYNLSGSHLSHISKALHKKNRKQSRQKSRERSLKPPPQAIKVKRLHHSHEDRSHSKCDPSKQTIKKLVDVNGDHIDSKGKSLLKASLGRNSHHSDVSVKTETVKICHEERLNAEKKAKKRLHHLTDVAKEEPVVPHKQRPVSSPLEEILAESSKKTDNIKIRKKIDKKSEQFVSKVFKSSHRPIPKLEDGPKPMRILESRRTSSEPCTATQSPCAMLYSAEPRKSYCTKADGSEASVPAPGCRAPASPTWLDDLLFSICRWDPRWLEESRLTHRSKSPNILPAKEMADFLKRKEVKYRFENFAEYHKHFYRALLLQFWDDVSVAHSKQRRSDEKLLVAVDRVKSKPLKGGRVVKTFYCHCGIIDGNKETSIRGGDLLCMRIIASEIKEVFAYAEVSGGAKELISNTVHLSPVLDSSPDITHKFSFRMSVCVEEHSVLLPWEPADIISCRVTKISNVYEEVEMFKFLSDVSKFPELMDLIMNPSAEEECSEYMGLKSCSDMSVAQKRVICSIMKSIHRPGPSVNVVAGEPGTGKTRTMCALAQELAERARRDERDARIIIAGKTNRTLEGIMKCLLNRRTKEKDDPNVFRVVRLGSRLSSDDSRISSVTVKALAERHSRASGVDADVNELRRLEQERRHIDRDFAKAQRRGQEVSADLTKKLAECTRKMLVLEKKISDQKTEDFRDENKESDEGLILKNADIIVTPASCSQERNLVEKKLTKRQHHVLMLDDAAEITEPAILKLIIIFNVTDLVLVGDKQNHVPFAPSFLARKAGLNIPLMQRYTFAIFKEKGLNSWHILQEQQRMHPLMFKGLESLFDPDCTATPALKFPRQAVQPFTIFNCTYVEKDEEEVDFIEKILDGLLKSRINLKDVGFTSFSRVILAEARHRASSSESLWKSINILKPDALSGSQFRVMIVSCGLSPKALLNMKKSTIVLTRAQRALFICGNFRTMVEIPDPWKDIIKSGKQLSRFEDVSADATPEIILSHFQSTPE